MAQQVDFATATTVGTVSGNTVEIGEKENYFYILEQRDIEFMMSQAWLNYEKMQRRDYWGNFVIGLLFGLIIMGIIK